MIRSRSIAVLLAGALGLAGCKDRAELEARRAVMTYLDKLVQAYRASDESLVDPLVGEAQGRKLLGLIGVKRDADLVLDAKLLDLQFEGFTRGGEEQLLVDTRERWHYRDRSIATGAQLGEDSTDEYALRYHLVRDGGRLLVERIEFRAPPAVGRKTVPLTMDRRTMHGLPPNEPAPGGTP